MFAPHMLMVSNTISFDDAHIIGWTRAGNELFSGSGCAVLISNGEGGEKTMYLGSEHAGKKCLPC